jgi:hypothetical protein
MPAPDVPPDMPPPVEPPRICPRDAPAKSTMTDITKGILLFIVLSLLTME